MKLQQMTASSPQQQVNEHLPRHIEQSNTATAIAGLLALFLFQTGTTRSLFHPRGMVQTCHVVCRTACNPHIMGFDFSFAAHLRVWKSVIYIYSQYSAQRSLYASDTRWPGAVRMTFIRGCSSVFSKQVKDNLRVHWSDPPRPHWFIWCTTPLVSS